MKIKEERIDPQVAAKAIWLEDYRNLTKLRTYNLAYQWGVPISILESPISIPSRFRWYYLLPLFLIPLFLIPFFLQPSVEVPVNVDPIELKISWYVEDGELKATKVESIEE